MSSVGGNDSGWWRMVEDGGHWRIVLRPEDDIVGRGGCYI